MRPVAGRAIIIISLQAHAGEIGLFKFRKNVVFQNCLPSTLPPDQSRFQKNVGNLLLRFLYIQTMLMIVCKAVFLRSLRTLELQPLKKGENRQKYGFFSKHAQKLHWAKKYGYLRVGLRLDCTVSHAFRTYSEVHLALNFERNRQNH